MVHIWWHSGKRRFDEGLIVGECIGIFDGSKLRCMFETMDRLREEDEWSSIKIDCEWVLLIVVRMVLVKVNLKALLCIFIS